MGIRTALASVVVLGALFATTPAFAKELREPRAHLVFDVPDSWNVTTEGDFAMAFPVDETFHLRVLANSRGLHKEAEEEEWGLTFIRNHFTDITVDTHARRIDYNNMMGFEVFGHGKEKNGQHSPGKWFFSVLVDKKDSRKGAIVIGTGTVAGFEKHHPGINEALRTMRQY
jgi:hypothetical protein